MVDGHKRESRIDLGIDDGNVQLVDRVDRLPVVDGRAAQRVDSELEPGAANGVHVDNTAQIADIGRDKVLLMRRICLEGGSKAHAPHASIAIAQKLVGPVLDPRGHIGVGRPAVCRVVLEPSVLGWVVRRGDDDTIGEPIAPGAVVNQDGAGDDRCRREPIIPLDYRRYAVCRQHFECRALSRPRKCVRVLAHVERPAGPLGFPVIANGLGDRQDMGFGKRPA